MSFQLVCLRCMECVYPVEPFPLSNSVYPAWVAVVSRSWSGRGPVWICVIVTGSITELKCDNIICNNKNKLAVCQLYTIYAYSSVRGEIDKKTTHTNPQRNESAPNAHDASLQFVSQTWAGSDFRPCGLLNIYRSTHQAACHYCLQESDLWGFLGRREKGDMVWMSFREKLREGQATMAIQ